MAKDKFNPNGSVAAAGIGAGSSLLGSLLILKSQKDILDQKLQDRRAAELASQQAAEAQQRRVVGAAQQTRGGLGLLQGLRTADRMQQQAQGQVAQAKMADMARQDAFDKEQRVREERLGAGIGGALAAAGTQLATAYNGAPGSENASPDGNSPPPASGSLGAVTGAKQGQVAQKPAPQPAQQQQAAPAPEVAASPNIGLQSMLPPGYFGGSSAPGANQRSAPRQDLVQSRGGLVSDGQIGSINSQPVDMAPTNQFLDQTFPGDGKSYGQGLAVPARAQAPAPASPGANPAPIRIGPEPSVKQMPPVVVGPATGQLSIDAATQKQDIGLVNDFLLKRGSAPDGPIVPIETRPDGTTSYTMGSRAFLVNPEGEVFEVHPDEVRF